MKQLNLSKRGAAADKLVIQKKVRVNHFAAET